MREYSDTLLIFQLKGRRPEKYRESVDHNHTGDIKFVLQSWVPTIEGKAEEVKVIGEGDG